MDDEVDDLFIKIYNDLIQCAAENPDMIGRSNQLEWVAHNLERVANRVTIICEWVIYIVTSVYSEMDPENENIQFIDLHGDQLNFKRYGS